MKLDNTKIINYYYNHINEILDKHYDKVMPTGLKKHLSNKTQLTNFKKRWKLEGVENIDKVIYDCVEDRCNAELDGVLTFESYTFNNSIVEFTPIDKNEENEIVRYLADLYKTSRVNIKKIEDGFYTIDTLTKDINVIAINKKQLYVLRDNFINFVSEYIKSQKFIIPEISMEIKLNNLDENSITKLATDMITGNVIKKAIEDRYKGYKFRKTDNFNIFEKKD